jgi:hypothetical protein
MPLPYKNVRYRFRTIGPTQRQRLAFSNGKVVEVTNYTKRDGTWVKQHIRGAPTGGKTYKRKFLDSNQQRRAYREFYDKDVENVEVKKNRVKMDYLGDGLSYPFTKVEHLETIGNWKHKIDDDEIVIDKDVKKENVKPLLVHEAVEEHLVKDKGLTVDKAHEIATEAEKDYVVTKLGRPWQGYNSSVMRTKI